MSPRFCRLCGASLRALVDDRFDCTGCGEPTFLNPAPTASAIVLNDAGEVLLTKRAIEPFLGYWDLPGGFCQAGESLDEAVRRELREETGLEVAVERMIGSYPDTYGELSTPTLNAFFLCSASGVGVPADDVAEVAWVAVADLPPLDEIAFTCCAVALTEFLQTR